MIYEFWRPVRGYVGLYLVSDKGRIKNQRTGKILKPEVSNGYLRVTLCKNRINKHLFVHRIVWEAFKYPIPDGFQIDHRNTIRDENRIENLRCVTPKENAWNPITKDRLDNSNKKKAQDPEWLKKNAEILRNKNDEWRNNQIEAAKKTLLKIDREYNIKRTKEVNNKPVNQFTKDGVFVKRFESMTEASRELGIDVAQISAICLKKPHYKSAKGSTFSFADT